MTVKIPAVELVDINLLKVDGDNPNRMTAQQMEALIKSMTDYGFIVPIVTNNEYLIADGEHKLTAAKTLKMEKVPIIRLPVKDVDRRILRQVLNKVRGQHVKNQDALEFKKIIDAGRTEDLSLFLTMKETELVALLKLHSMQKNSLDVIPKLQATTNIQLGDVFSLGRHRIMCGDATNPSHVQKLIGDNKIDQLQTDPPFGVYGEGWDSLRGRGHTAGATTYRDIDPKQYEEWTNNWLKNIPFADYNTIYIWINARNLRSLLNATNNQGIHIGALLVWAKNTFVLSTIDYRPMHELCFYGWKIKHKFYGKNRVTTFYIKKPVANKEHPTSKPVDLIKPLIKDGTKPGGKIYEPFNGSGTTLMAAEVTERTCFAMEIEPLYVELACHRWENFTKKKRKVLS